MRFPKTALKRHSIAPYVAMGLLLLVGLAPSFVAAEAFAKGTVERGRFVSYENGILKIQANSGDLRTTELPANTQTLLWNTDEGIYKPATTAETLSQAKPGTWCVVVVGNEGTVLRVGSRMSKTVGTFVSFKDSRLLVLGKNLGESFTKKYGDTVHFNKFRDDVPAYESIDGGAYQSVGMANKALSNVREGAVIAIYGEGDDNIVRVEIGAARQ